jgi:hypothetical protein
VFADLCEGMSVLLTAHGMAAIVSLSFYIVAGQSKGKYVHMYIQMWVFLGGGGEGGTYHSD